MPISPIQQFLASVRFKGENGVWALPQSPYFLQTTFHNESHEKPILIQLHAADERIVPLSEWGRLPFVAAMDAEGHVAGRRYTLHRERTIMATHIIPGMQLCFIFPSEEAHPLAEGSD